MISIEQVATDLFTVTLYCSNCGTEQEQQFKRGTKLLKRGFTWEEKLFAGSRKVVCKFCNSDDVNRRQRKG